MHQNPPPKIQEPDQCSTADTAVENDEGSTVDDDQSETSDEASMASDISEMEPVEDRKGKISELLGEIGLQDYSVEAIQHGDDFMNCVYRLTPPEDSAQHYILRVANGGWYENSEGRQDKNGRCTLVANEVAVLTYLKDKIPVPRVKAYCITKDNVLKAAYTVQTLIPGQSLNEIWNEVEYADKVTILDEYLNLLVKLDAVQFKTAGSLEVSAPLPTQVNDFTSCEDPKVCFFDGITAPWETTTDAGTIHDRAGSDIKLLLQSHLNELIKNEVDSGSHEYDFSSAPLYKQCLSILEEMTSEGYFADQPHTIVLHHWDLEPRNIMVSKASGAWKITGVIDWDDVVALPQPLARKMPVWIWWFPDEEPSASVYYNDDQYGYPEPSGENRALKEYFDEKVEALLPGYKADCYERGRWLRRIWTFARRGVDSEYVRGFLAMVPRDWEARSKKQLPISEDLESEQPQSEIPHPGGPGVVVEEEEPGERKQEHSDPEHLKPREQRLAGVKGVWTVPIGWVRTLARALRA